MGLVHNNTYFVEKPILISIETAQPDDDTHMHAHMYACTPKMIVWVLTFTVT